MNISEIAIEVITRLVGEEEFRRLAEHGNDEEDQREIPIPDSIPKEIENPVIGDLYDDSGFEENNVIILGTYTPMRSPGVITYYLENIINYTGSLIRKIVKSGFEFNFELVVSVSFLVIEDITFHESFHYYCDYKRYLTGAVYERNKEEALAVAHSYNMIYGYYYFYRRHPFYNDLFNRIRNDLKIRLNPKILHQIPQKDRIDIFIKEHYSLYRLPGYKDWKKYTYPKCYENDFFNYIKNKKLETLLSNGVPVNNIRTELITIGLIGAKIVVK